MGTNERMHLVRDDIYIIRFNGADCQVCEANFDRIVSGKYVRNVKIAVHAADFETICTKCLQVSAACQKSHFMAGTGQ